MAVQKRSHGFVSRVAVPGDLRPLVRRREIVRTLSTGSHREASHRAAEFEGRVAALFRRLRHDRPMDHDQIDALVAQYLNAELRGADERLASSAWATNRKTANAMGESWPALAASLLADRAQELEEALEYNRLSEAMPEAMKLAPGAPEVTLQVLARRLLEAKHAATIAELKALEGEPLPRIQVAAASPEVTPKASPMVSAMVSDYIAFKQAGGKWTPKTTAQLTNLFRVMVELIGDKPAADVSKEDMRALYRLMPQMPTHAPKRYPNLPAPEAIAAADADGLDERLSPKTQNDYYTHIKSLWKWALENDYVDKSPAVVLKDVDETAAWDQRPAFIDGQLAAYFAALRDKAEPAMLWVPLLMLYAGLRMEEAAKLTPEDVREEQGVCVVDVNRRRGRLKTKNADRLVPIHSAILPELLKQVASRPSGGNLWGLAQSANGTYSSALSKRLNRTLDVACPENDKLVTYSLRHTFATRLKGADVQAHVISELMGHGVDELSVGRYGKPLSADQLREAVERLKIPAVLP